MNKNQALCKILNERYTWDEIKKSSKTKDGILAWFIYRKIAYVFTYILVNFFNVTPNAVTTLALISWFLSAVLIWHNYRILPIILILTGFILDCTDGNIARLKNQSSKTGKLYDNLVDRLSYAIIMMILTIKISDIFSTPYLIILGVLLSTFMNVTDSLRVDIEKSKMLDVHDLKIISDSESTIKDILRKVIPFIDWEKIIIGLGADILWTLLIIAIIFPYLYKFILMFLNILIIGELFLFAYIYTKN